MATLTVTPTIIPVRFFVLGLESATSTVEVLGFDADTVVPGRPNIVIDEVPSTDIL